MTDITDDPPPIEHDSINSDGMFITKVVSVEHARQIEAAAFARGVAAMQGEVEKLKKTNKFLHELNIECVTAENELRAKLKALEKQKPMARVRLNKFGKGNNEKTNATIESLLDIPALVSLGDGTLLYLAAGAKQ